jgi:isoleucyl-tRNA synthetase
VGESGSVHTATFPEAAELTEGISLVQRERVAVWTQLIALREPVLKSLETARQEKIIGAPLEAHVHLSAGPDLYSLLSAHITELPGIFIVSEVSIEKQDAAGLGVRIERAGGTKCERCWKYTHDVGSNPEFPTICASCAAAVQEYLVNA